MITVNSTTDVTAITAQGASQLVTRSRGMRENERGRSMPQAVIWDFRQLRKSVQHLQQARLDCLCVGSVLNFTQQVCKLGTAGAVDLLQRAREVCESPMFTLVGSYTFRLKPYREKFEVGACGLQVVV